MNGKYSKEEIDTLKAMGYRVEDDQIYTKYIVEFVDGIETRFYNLTNKNLRVFEHIGWGGYKSTNLILEPIFKGEENEEILSYCLMDICPTNVRILYDEEYIKPSKPTKNVEKYQVKMSSNFILEEVEDYDSISTYLSIIDQFLIRSMILKINLDYRVQTELGFKRSKVLRDWTQALRISNTTDLALVQFGEKSSYNLDFRNINDISIDDVLKYMQEVFRIIYKTTAVLKQMSPDTSIIDVIPTEIAYVRALVEKEKYYVITIQDGFPFKQPLESYTFQSIFVKNKPWNHIIIKKTDNFIL